MHNFIINGKKIETSEEMNLLDFIRDTLDITSLKNGCKEGSCGACMILVNGKKTRACLMTTQKADGAEILSVEGLSKREQEVYDYCFNKAE